LSLRKDEKIEREYGADDYTDSNNPGTNFGVTHKSDFIQGKGFSNVTNTNMRGTFVLNEMSAAVSVGQSIEQQMMATNQILNSSTGFKNQLLNPRDFAGVPDPMMS